MSPHAITPKFADLLDTADPARLFVIGGTFLVIAGRIFGDLCTGFILHPNIGNIGREMGAAVAAAAGLLLSAGRSRAG